VTEFTCFRGDFGEPVGEAAEETPMRCVGEGAAEHFQNVLGKVKGIHIRHPRTDAAAVRVTLAAFTTRMTGARKPVILEKKGLDG